MNIKILKYLVYNEIEYFTFVVCNAPNALFVKEPCFEYCMATPHTVENGSFAKMSTTSTSNGTSNNSCPGRQRMSWRNLIWRQN